MPLSDFVRTLNAPNSFFPKHYAVTGLDQPFVAINGRIFLQYANIRLESHYLPIIELASGKLHGHAASFKAFGLSTRIPLLPEAVFVLPTDDEEFIYLDRLVRTLHALNYLTKPAQGNLLLKVHTRHVLSVPSDHGLAFEEILKPCGLFPDQITLEIEIDSSADSERLVPSIATSRAAIPSPPADSDAATSTSACCAKSGRTSSSWTPPWSPRPGRSPGSSTI